MNDQVVSLPGVPRPLKPKSAISADLRAAYRAAEETFEALRKRTREFEKWLEKARKTLVDAVRSGADVEDGLVCRIIEEEEAVRMTWKLVMEKLYGEEAAAEAWEKVKHGPKEMQVNLYFEFREEDEKAKPTKISD